MSTAEERRWQKLSAYLSGLCLSEEKWEEFWARVRENFPEAEIDVHHTIDHVLTVTEYCVKIGPSSVLEWAVAGLLHDIGRVDETRAKKAGQVVKHAPVSAQKARVILGQFPLLVQRLDIEDIIDAIAKHSLLNDPTDSQLTADLKDADRLGAIGDLWGQVGRTICGCCTQKDLYNPDNPFCFGQRLIPGRCETVLGEVLCNLEWFLFLRNEKAKEIATPCITFIFNLLRDLGHN